MPIGAQVPPSTTEHPMTGPRRPRVDPPSPFRILVEEDLRALAGLAGLGARRRQRPGLAGLRRDPVDDLEARPEAAGAGRVQGDRPVVRRLRRPLRAGPLPRHAGILPADVPPLRAGPGGDRAGLVVDRLDAPPGLADDRRDEGPGRAG